MSRRKAVPEEWHDPTQPDDRCRPQPPKDFREVGELIRHGLRDALRRRRDPRRRRRTDALWEAFIRPGRAKFDLALRSTVDGDLAPLLEYLNAGGKATDGPVTDYAVVVDTYSNMVLAEALKQYQLRLEEKQSGKQPPPKHKPGPMHDALAHNIARLALVVFHKWKRANHHYSFSNHRISEEMRERALDIVLDETGTGEGANREKLLDLMNRPSRLRDSSGR